MIHDILNNSDGRFGTSPSMIPVIICCKGGIKKLAMFTINQVQVAVKKGDKFPELLEPILDRIDSTKNKKK